MEALLSAMDLRDGYTADHAHGVAALAHGVGQALGLDETELAEVELAGRLHDLGKIGVPDSILQKPGPLTIDEWEIVRQHPTWGAEMLAAVPGLERVAHITRHHHERFDGRGYPDGLAGEEIPLGSRIVAACDAYHALISPRPYRGPLRPHEALELLRATAGAQLDPAVVDALGEVTDDPLAVPVRRFRRGGTL